MPSGPNVDSIFRFTVDLVSSCFLNNTRDALIGIDLEGNIQTWNPAAESIYGYTSAEVIGGNIQILFPVDGEGDERAVAEQNFAMEAPALTGWEARQIDKNSTIVHAAIDSWPIFDADGLRVGACVAAREIARYKMLQSQLRHTQKLEAVGRLAGGIAHDFNNLLTIIAGYNSMIQRDLPPKSEIRDWSDQVEKAAERATLLTNQLLAFSRREVTEPRVLNLNEMVQDLDKMLRRIVGEDIKIALSLEPLLANIKADPGQISQLLTNLVVNSRDAMPRGGTLTIATRVVRLDAASAGTDRKLTPGTYVQLTVSDNGSGMDRETQRHLFEPFFTTKPKGKGTGLGLSIVHGIVSQLCGDITVRSELGEGTTFTIWLPITAERPVEKPAIPGEVRGPESPDITVLLVEDDGDVRHLARHMLLTHGYTVYETADCAEAIRICETIHVDVLLTDVVMPEMNGRELADVLRRSNESLKVVYMSGYIDDSLFPPNFLEPGSNFIRKPFTADYLHDRIAAVCNRGGLTNAVTGV